MRRKRKNTPTSDALDRANEFLRYIATEEAALKKALRKNITYDPDVFDDAFQNAVLKVYQKIASGEKVVRNFKNYFFIAAKYEYINLDNRSRRSESLHDRDYHAVEDCIDEGDNRRSKVVTVYDIVLRRVLDNFDASALATFVLRYQYKKSSREVAQIQNCSTRDVTCRMRRIRRFIKHDQICQQAKQTLYADD